MPNIFLKNMTGEIINIDVDDIDYLISYLCEYLQTFPENIVIFTNEEENIFEIEEGKIYNFLIRGYKNYNDYIYSNNLEFRLLFDMQSHNIDNNKNYIKYIIELGEEKYPFYCDENDKDKIKFYDYKNVDILDRHSFIGENIRFRDSSIEGMSLNDLVKLYFKDFQWNEQKYIENNIIKELEYIRNDIEKSYDPYEDPYNVNYDPYDPYEDD